jgi:predicted aspartyl protease
MIRMNPVLPICYLQCALVAAGPAFPAAAEQSVDFDHPAAEDLLFASPTRSDHNGRIVAPVMINGRGPFRFIVDTGAGASTISPQLAVTLGLDPAAESPMVVNGITGTAQVPSVSIHKLEAGALVIENACFPVVWAPLMAGADGILGMAGLENDCVFVDFRRDRVVISHSRGPTTHVGFDRVPARILRGGLMVADARIAGVRVHAIIDTGSERTLGNSALRDALYARRPAEAKPKMTDVFGATTDVVGGEMYIAPTIVLGPVRIARVTVVFGDFHIFEVWGMQALPALIIGMDVLGMADSLGIDFRHSELYIQSPQQSPGLEVTRFSAWCPRASLFTAGAASDPYNAGSVSLLWRAPRDAVADLQSQLRRLAAPDLQHRAHRLPGVERFERQRMRTRDDLDDRSLQANEDHVELDVGVLHPHGHDARRCQWKQHSLTGRQVAHEHQPLLLPGGGVGDPDVEMPLPGIVLRLAMNDVQRRARESGEVLQRARLREADRGRAQSQCQGEGESTKRRNQRADAGWRAFLEHGVFRS